MRRTGMSSFLLIWLGQIASMIGSGISSFAFGVWTYERTGSVSQFTLVMLCITLPQLLVGPFAGALVDRWDRRWVMILSDGGAGLCTLCLAGLLLAGRLEIWHLYVGLLAGGVLGAFQEPAYMASITMLVPKEHFGRASGLIQIPYAIGQLASPVLAGVLLGLIGLLGVIALDAATFVFAVLTMLAVRIPRPPRSAAGLAASGSLLRETLSGWRYITARRGLLILLLLATVTNFGLAVVETMIFPLVLSFATATTLGIVLSVSGVGMLAGTLLISVWGGPRRRIAAVIGFTILQGLALLVGGLRPDPVLVAAAAFVFLLCAPIAIGCSQAIVQSKVEPDLQGRVLAIRQVVGRVAMPLAYLSAGLLADRLFEPLLAVDGRLAGSVGVLIGTGSGRGIALMIMLVGLLFIVAGLLAYAHPRLRRVEDELADSVLETPSGEQHETFAEDRPRATQPAGAAGPGRHLAGSPAMAADQRHPQPAGPERPGRRDP